VTIWNESDRAPADKITLLDVHKAVGRVRRPFRCMIRQIPGVRVGRNIQGVLEKRMTGVQRAIEAELDIGLMLQGASTLGFTH
jgi:DNA-binding IscR family transcriptional regulator